MINKQDPANIGQKGTDFNPSPILHQYQSRNITLRRQKKRVAVSSLGCKVNQYEAAAFVSGLAASGLVELVPFTAEADLYLINTCAVTARAGAQSRQLLRQAAARNPQARLLVTGCYAQVEHEKLVELVDNPLCIVGNNYKERVVELALSDRRCDVEMFFSNMSPCRDTAPLLVEGRGERTRAILKVQDGCSQRCSYCIVPLARGPSRSLPLAHLIKQAEIYAANGYRELVLSGIHLGHYGDDLSPRMSLVSLVKSLIARNLPLRYRLSSLEPSEISPELLSLIRDEEALLPHLHIPMQSGDNDILKAMNRPCSAEDYERVLNECLQTVPDLAIGVDVMVGFPGEDESRFHNTMKLLERLDIAYLHVFPYSSRPGTVAARLRPQVAGKVKRERAEQLRGLSDRKKTAFYNRFLGQRRRVLVEKALEDDGAVALDTVVDYKSANSNKGMEAKRVRATESTAAAEEDNTPDLLMKGFTDNYIPVFFKGQPKLANEECLLLLERLYDKGVWGSLP